MLLLSIPADVVHVDFRVPRRTAINVMVSELAIAGDFFHLAGSIPTTIVPGYSFVCPDFNQHSF